MPDPRRRIPQLVVVHEAPEGQDAAAHDAGWSILMAHAQDGDRRAYRLLLEQIAPYLRTLAGSRHRSASDVEDAVQDILLTVHAIRHTYDPTRPFAPWLATIAKRRLIDRLRRQGRQRKRETALTAEHETFPTDQANFDDGISDRRELQAALQGLPSGQRQAVQLLRLEELSLREAATVSGMSVAALKVALHRALKKLRLILTSGNDQT